MTDENQKLYARRGIVAHYAQLKQLQPAEQTILELLQDQLSQMRMLDIGVGAGRTTQHFANRVPHYVGIDYSAEMIAACQQRFAHSAPQAEFAVCDARDLSQFAANSFDFVLFSYNGIDLVPPGDRTQILQEVRRVSKPGAYFCFSSHHLEAMEAEFNWRTKVSLNPLTTYVNLVMWAILRGCNYRLGLEQLQQADYAILRDESHNFRSKTYYGRSPAQLRQLAPYFENIRVFSWSSGLELKTEAERRSHRDLWLYYLGQVRQ